MFMYVCPYLQDLVSNADQSTHICNSSHRHKGDEYPIVLLTTDDVEAQACPLGALKSDFPHFVRLDLNSLSDLWSGGGGGRRRRDTGMPNTTDKCSSQKIRSLRKVHLVISYVRSG